MADMNDAEYNQREKVWKKKINEIFDDETIHWNFGHNYHYLMWQFFRRHAKWSPIVPHEYTSQKKWKKELKKQTKMHKWLYINRNTSDDYEKIARYTILTNDFMDRKKHHLWW